jgi:gliding motility-associated-like protein
VFFGLCVQAAAHAPRVSFTENNGQWPEQVLYRARIPGGVLFIEREALTWVVRTGDHRHHHGDPDHALHEADPKVHAWRVHFQGGLAQGGEGGMQQPHRENYFLGDDPQHWGADCRVFGEVVLRDVWPGVDIRFSGERGLKYDVLLAPGLDPAVVQLLYEGQDALQLREGDLHVVTSAATVVEKRPVSYCLRNGVQVPVASRYRLEGNMLRFEFPEGHDAALPLVIDPEFTFGSYSGSTADNFGFTATYDADGSLYGGGIVFQQGYPTTTGALDATFNGGTTDVGVSKWSPDGSLLVWSTYIGGSHNEAPHSLVVNSTNELFILGTTGSSNFPTTPGCYDPTFNGGSSITFPAGYGFFYENGSDLFISRLSVGGNALVGSTFFGGSGADGLNLGPSLYYNYGDPFRGEIALNAAGEPVIATSTTSLNMPTTPGAPQATYGGGGQDAFFLRMNPALTTLQWATYYGGTESDSGYGVQFASNGQMYFTGGTLSMDLPMAGTPFDPSFNGGVDGYIARYAASGTNLLSTTFLGTPQYDQSYFVQLDLADNVYVVGQTRGNYPVTPGKYANPGSSQFIHKLNTTLSASLWSTRIGNGSGTEDVSPSAFLVSDCGQIYFSGWAGGTNNIALPTNSTTLGLPVTPDAFQGSTSGSDFYLMVLEPEAVALNYATFFGGSSAEHVDGGTSRFDKDGKVYQAVCAGCGGQDDFPTTPGAWSNTNNSNNCNLGVFKFDLSSLLALIEIDGPDVVCAPSTVQFVSNSTGGDTYYWTFGDGGTSTETAPQHTYIEPGVYTVSLALTASSGCVLGDTAYLQVTVLPQIEAIVEPIEPLCPGGSVQLSAGPAGQEYSWSPATGLSATDVQDPVASPSGTTTYQVVVSGACGTDSTTVEVVVAEPQGTALPDVTICLGESTTLGASGGDTYLWSPAGTLSNPELQNPVATPLDTTIYTVLITTVEGCEMQDSVQVNVVFSIPPQVLVDTMVCEGGSVQLLGPPAEWYQWQPASGLVQQDVVSPTVSPAAPTWYILLCGNVCGTTLDSAFVDVVNVLPSAWPDTIVCPGMPLQLYAAGGDLYSWSPATYLDDPTSAAPNCTPYGEITYTILVTDQLGCSASTQLTVLVHPPPFVDAGPDISAPYGQMVQLNGQGDGSLSWEPVDLLDLPQSPNPRTRPEESTLYTLTVTDANGCKTTDQVWVILDGSLFVPNTFTPNGDGVNDWFGAWGKDIAEIKLQVFNRWGEMIYETNSLDGRWDGTYSGVDSPIDTYVWRIDVKELNGRRSTLYGHVNLLR